MKSKVCDKRSKAEFDEDVHKDSRMDVAAHEVSDKAAKADST